MRVIADLQIHSKYARACSKDISIENLVKWGKIKGLDLLGVGDFQHPQRREEIDEKLKEDDNGILWFEGEIEGKKEKFAFLWQTEISLMFSQGGKRRAVHLLIFAPNGKLADKITEYLGSKGRLDYDGRPIFGMSCRDAVKELKEIDDRIEIIPAHCMTPWFGLFGSKSGFDSLKECFEDQVDKIYAVESGISADPPMLWRFPELANGSVRVVSFSDAHSFWPWRLGREASIFEFEELSYDNFMKAVRTGKGLEGTIETPPEYGKYHWDGHRNCDFVCSPSKTKELEGKCPKCGKDLIIGVDYRVEEIAEEKHGFEPKDKKNFYSILPLHELISIVVGVSVNTKKVWGIYNDLIEKFGNEFNILLNVSREELEKAEIDEKLIDVIILSREGKIEVEPGYDGEYGRLILPENLGEGKDSEKQANLF